VPVSTSAYSRGPTKCIADVTESTTGRSLKRSRGAEYATTPNTTRASTTPAATSPSASSTSRNGTFVTAHAHRIRRCTVRAVAGSARAPSMPPLRGFRRSDS
jgi:hypothetical protein